VVEVEAYADEGCGEKEVEGDGADDAAAELFVRGASRDGLGGHGLCGLGWFEMQRQIPGGNDRKKRKSDDRQKSQWDEREKSQCDHYFERGWVTMLMLLMPADFTASITEAKAPKGTDSSART
jgi:hypothetical protein